MTSLALPGAAQTIGAFPQVSVPSGNPITTEKALLGQALFFEEQLSSDNTMACATCHLPEAGGTDPRAGARAPGADGVLGTLDDEFGSPGMVLQGPTGRFKAHTSFALLPQATERHAPTVIGAAFFATLFWDGRATSPFRDLQGQVVLGQNAALETQAVAPPLSSVEMAAEARTWTEIVAKLGAVRPLDLASDVPRALAEFVFPAADYRALFARAFGSAEITRERIAFALATYERTLVPDRTPFDLGTMTSEQAAGFEVFRTRGNCTACHTLNGLFSDGFQHSIALPGHFRLAKTPTLRNVGLQRRLTSSGQFRDLDQLVSHYEQISFFSPALSPAERAAVLAFLGNALTDGRVLRREPPFDRPTLRSEREPPGSNLFGTAWPGSGGRLPELLAHLPANLGNADFKLGLGNGRAGAAAFLLVGAARSRPGANFRGVPVHVEVDGAQLRTLVLGASGAERGVGTLALPLPGDAALLGLRSYVQGFVLDPNALGGLAASRAAEFQVFSMRRGAHGTTAAAGAPGPAAR